MVERILQMSFCFGKLISTPAGSRNPRGGLWLHCLRSVQRSYGNVVPASKSLLPQLLRKQAELEGEPERVHGYL